MKRIFLLSLIASITLLTAHSTAQQTSSLDVPRTISYQGLLTSTDGTPLPDNTYDITVTLYSDAGGVHPLWQDTYHSDVRNGIFNLYLGSGNTPLPNSTEINRPLWVGTSVNGSTEMLPLTPLASSPYALNLPDNAVTTGKLADGAVTAQKVDMDYVAAISINGEKISSKGTTLDIRGTDGIALNYDQANNVLNVSREKQAGTIDPEKKGTSILDATDASQNWKGRTNVAGALTFTAPVGIYGTLAGGASNVIDAGVNYAFIGGGQNNFIQNITNNAVWAAIAGGHGNYISHDHGFIGGGHYNRVEGSNGTIGGGWSNSLASEGAAITGGKNNNIQSPSDYAFIGGGLSNATLQSTGGVIGGGGSNTLTSTAAGGANYSTIAGGEENTVDGQYGSIGGGYNNSISNYNGTISGGRNNIVSGHTGVIGGGYVNEVRALDGFIGAGTYNLIDANADHSVIGGGESNEIQQKSFHSTIGGGANNTILAAPPDWGGNQYTIGSIPGGDNLIAQSWAQTVIGGWNVAKGAMPFRYFTSPLPLSLKNGPIFIIGNGNGTGSPANRSNAFEVSYNGHSIVTDFNGSGTSRGAMRGGTYTDNVIYAWGSAEPMPGSPGTVSVLCDFGVASISYVTTGHYHVTLNPVESDGTTEMTLDCGSVTATIVSPSDPPESHCAFINTSQINNNQFDIFISKQGLTKAMGFVGMPPTLVLTDVQLTCEAVDLPFTFKVTAAPSAP